MMAESEDTAIHMNTQNNDESLLMMPRFQTVARGANTHRDSYLLRAGDPLA